jgi:hypothetical protein
MDDRDRIQSHRDLKVWQLGMDITEQVYDLTKAFPDCERFGLVSQMRRAAVRLHYDQSNTIQRLAEQVAEERRMLRGLQRSLHAKIKNTV